MPLYHYTDAQAVQSIIENRKIWLTDTKFLNDSQELFNGLEIIESQIESSSDSELQDLQYLNKALGYLKESFNEFVRLGPEIEPVFVFSLSSNKDTLSQWRAYGSYAIEFDEVALKRELNLLVIRCIYDEENKITEAKKYIKSALLKINSKLIENKGSLNDCGGIVTQLFVDASVFKNKGFIEEGEARVFISASDIAYPEGVSYRPKNDMLIPYVEFEIPINCIKSICVGPMVNQEQAYSSMKAFVEKIDWLCASGSSDNEFKISVVKSKISYRG